MPKKTKREKMLARERRKTSLASPPSTGTFSFAATKQESIREESDNVELAVIRHDLFRTIVFAIVAFGIEFGIYWYINGR